MEIMHGTGLRMSSHTVSHKGTEIKTLKYHDIEILKSQNSKRFSQNYPISYWSRIIFITSDFVS